MARVLWVSVETPDREGQGGQRRQYHQIRSLVERGHDVTVLVPWGRSDDASIRALVSVRRARMHVRGYRIPGRLGRVHRIVSDHRWDGVIASHHGSAWLLPARMSRPVLVDFHNVTSYWYRTRGDMARAASEHESESNAIARATMVTTCSDVETARLLEMHPEVQGKVFTSPIGVDPLEWPDRGFSRDQPRVVLFGG